MTGRKIRLGTYVLILLFMFVSTTVFAVPTSPPAQPRITQAVNNSNRVTLTGNTNQRITSGTDLGALASDTPLLHLQLLMQRSPEREQAVQAYINDLHNPSSPNFHQWLTAAQYGELYGPAKSDTETVTSWMKSQGLTVNSVYTNGLSIDFSGPVSAVESAFGVTLRNYNVDGSVYMSNAADPSIPAALANAVVGVTSLNNFFPRPQMHKRDTRIPAKSAATKSDSLSKILHSPEFTFNDGFNEYFVAPGDFNTIYNVSPLWPQNIRGAGQTIVVIEDTRMYTPDWQTFRDAFGLSGFAGTFSQIEPPNPNGATNCFPTVNGDEGEAALDAEWAGVAAPDADIVLAECNDTATVFGGLIAVQNLLNASATPPAIMSISYGECEAGNGAAANASYNSTYQQAVAEGTTIIVSSGDESATSCDANKAEATHGIGVSGFASTPYNVAVGGTDFSDTASNTNAQFWGTANDALGGSALSYIPEIPWDDACSNSTLISFVVANAATTGWSNPDPVAFCNSTVALNGVVSGGFLAPVANWLVFPSISTASGSGGPSGCATGSPSTSGVVNGTCAGWPQPTFQSASGGSASVLGMPANGVRNIPDVSLFASNGQWGHSMWLCNSDTTEGGGTCDFANDPDDAELVNAAGGTSFSAPAYAGIQALINQMSGSRQGNINVLLYKLGAQEYGTTGSPNAAGLASCNSQNGAGVGASCVFRDVTAGDFSVPCRKGTPNCFVTSASTSGNCGGSGASKGCGVVSSTNPASASVAYTSTPGWDFTTGLGSVNAASLVQAFAPTSLQFTTQPVSTTAGQTMTVAVSVFNNFGQLNATLNSGNVTLSISSASLSGTLIEPVVDGVATFIIAVNQPGTGYTLVATSDSGLLPPTSSPFDITGGAAAKLAFTTQPSNATAGSSIGTVSVSIEDAGGNLITADTSSVSVALTTPNGAVLSGTLTQTASGGVATFTDLSVDKAGTYTLTATDGALASAVSASFTVGAATADHLTFAAQPANAASGALLGNVTVDIVDSFGNIVTADNSTVSVALTSAAGATLSGITSVAAVNGVATFSTLSVDLVGTYSLTATDASVTSPTATSMSFTISAGAADHLTFTAQPSDASAGGSIGLVVVNVVDAAGNAVTSDTSAITVALTTPNGAVLSGTTTVNASGGVATFPNLTVDKVGIYTLTASDGALGTATSNSFSISTGPNAILVFTQQPTDTAAGEVVTPAITVSLEDGLGNVVTSDSTTVVNLLVTGCGGATVASQMAVNGVATFGDVRFYTVASSEGMFATASGYQSAASTSFNVTANDADLIFSSGFETCSP